MAHAFCEPAKPQRRIRFSFRNSFQRKLSEPNILHFAGQNDDLVRARVAEAMGESDGVNVQLGIEPLPSGGIDPFRR